MAGYPRENAGEGRGGQRGSGGAISHSISTETDSFWLPGSIGTASAASARIIGRNGGGAPPPVPSAIRRIGPSRTPAAAASCCACEVAFSTAARHGVGQHRSRVLDPERERTHADVVTDGTRRCVDDLARARQITQHDDDVVRRFVPGDLLTLVVIVRMDRDRARRDVGADHALGDEQRDELAGALVRPGEGLPRGG